METEKAYHFFISHASEDKETIALPIYRSLSKLGFKVWLDRAEIKIGDNIVEKIQEGLSHSRYGIVILSKSFFAKKKNWTRRELDVLLMRDIAGGRAILPIWHEVNDEFIMEHSPFLASTYAISTEQGVNFIIQEIIQKAQVDNIFPAPIVLLAVLWRPSSVQAWHTIGADVFCIVSKCFSDPSVYLNVHSLNCNEFSRVEMKFYRDIGKYTVYSTFLYQPGACFKSTCSVSMTTEYGEFVDDNNGRLYTSGSRTPELINYYALRISGAEWMTEDVRKWSHENVRHVGYGGKPLYGA